MNDILTNYVSITELELNKRISYYEHSAFSNETINLLIPDVVAYVHKIFNCLRWAAQSRNIIEDVCNQIVELRTSRNVLLQSIGYHVGSLELDGRAYAQQNIHQYCRYIAEINDCLCQIINIVFGIGYRQWECFEAEQILKHANVKKHSNITILCKNFYHLIELHKNFDNFDKHNLILWGHEKLSPTSMHSVEYYFDMDDQEYRMSDWINECHEQNIKIAIVELLDNIFALASCDKNPSRKYAHILCDDLSTDNELPIYTDRYLASHSIMPLKMTTKSNGNTRVVESISYIHDDSSPIMPKIHLARLDQEVLKNGVLQIGLYKLDLESFDIFQNGNMIGKYQCKGKKDLATKYFHFKEYEFIPQKH